MPKSIIYIFLFISSTFIGIEARAQFFKKYKNREIIVNTDTTVIKAMILQDKINIKTNKSSTYYWYNANQIKSNEGAWYGNLMNGTFRKFDNKNNLIEQGYFKKGLKTRIWTNWSKEGKLIREEHWRKGVKHGKFTEYINSQKNIRSGKYQNNLLHKRVIIKDLEGNVVDAIMYRKGKIITTVPKTNNEKKEKIPRKKKIKNDEDKLGNNKGAQKKIRKNEENIKKSK